MTMLTRIWRVFFPPSKWSKCHEPMPWERAAQYEIRLGRHKAELRMQEAQRTQRFDALTSARVRPAIKPKLPADNVVPIKRRKRAAA